MRHPNAEEQALKSQVTRWCADDRAQLLLSQPFIARLLLYLEIVAVQDDRLPTAGTDGRCIYVNAAFMAGRTAEDRRFILAHEVWHCALAHIRRSLGREQQLWNWACDVEVNNLLSDAFGYCPADALQLSKFRTLSAEAIYQHFLQMDSPRKGSAQKIVNSALGRDDSHEDTGLFDLFEDTHHDFDEHNLQDCLARDVFAGVIDPDFRPTVMSRDSEREWNKRIIEAAQATEHQRGTLPGYLRRLIERLRRPQISWRQVLASHVQSAVALQRRWLPPNRRHVYQQLYLPSRRGDSLELAIAVDTSGSCVGYLPAFFGELRGILTAASSVTLRVVEFDAQVTSERTITEEDLHELDSWQWSGGGGSDTTGVFDLLAQDPPSLLLVLTDGLVVAPSHAPPFPVLWCLTSSGRPPAPWGQLLTIPRDVYRRWDRPSRGRVQRRVARL